MNDTQSSSHLTGRKFLRGALGLLSDSSPVLLGIIGFDGKLKFLNPAWEKLLGYPREELLNRSLSELMQQLGPTAATALVDRLLAEDKFDPMECGLRCRDGTCKWFFWNRRFDSEQQAIFIAGYDITEQKSLQVASLLRSYEQSGRANRAADAP
jgi:PAS domain S-box-containing protein